MLFFGPVSARRRFRGITSYSPIKGRARGLWRIRGTRAVLCLNRAFGDERGEQCPTRIYCRSKVDCWRHIHMRELVTLDHSVRDDRERRLLTHGQTSAGRTAYRHPDVRPAYLPLGGGFFAKPNHPLSLVILCGILCRRALCRQLWNDESPISEDMKLDHKMPTRAAGGETLRRNTSFKHRLYRNWLRLDINTVV